MSISTLNYKTENFNISLENQLTIKYVLFLSNLEVVCITHNTNVKNAREVILWEEVCKKKRFLFFLKQNSVKTSLGKSIP